MATSSLGKELGNGMPGIRNSTCKVCESMPCWGLEMTWRVAIWEEGREQMATDSVGLGELLALKGQVQKGGVIRLVV